MLRVEGLSVAYGPVAGVTNVSLQVGQGELLAVLGPNGAGKTSLLEAIAGRTPAVGRVWVGDVEISRMSTSKRLRHGVALVPQGREILKELTVGENLALAACIHSRRDARRRCADVYETIPILKPLIDRKAGYLSGGEQQSLAIARAIIANPRVLLLDEPSFGLSPALRVGILDLVAHERDERGLSVVLAEQFTDLAMRYAQHVLVLSHRTPVWSGAAADATSKDIEKAYFV